MIELSRTSTHLILGSSSKGERSVMLLCARYKISSFLACSKPDRSVMPAFSAFSSVSLSMWRAEGLVIPSFFSMAAFSRGSGMCTGFSGKACA